MFFFLPFLLLISCGIVRQKGRDGPLVMLQHRPIVLGNSGFAPACIIQTGFKRKFKLKPKLIRAHAQALSAQPHAPDRSPGRSLRSQWPACAAASAAAGRRTRRTRSVSGDHRVTWLRGVGRSANEAVERRRSILFERG